MENITTISVFLAVVGIITAFLIRLQAAMKKPDSGPFMMSKWVNENWIDIILGVIGTFVLLVLPNQFGVDFGHQGGPEAHAFLSGLAGQLVVSKLKAIINTP